MLFDDLPRDMQRRALAYFAGGNPKLSQRDAWVPMPGILPPVLLLDASKPAPKGELAVAPTTVRFDWDRSDPRLRVRHFPDPGDLPSGKRDAAWLVVVLQKGDNVAATHVRLTHAGKRRLFLLNDLQSA